MVDNLDEKKMSADGHSSVEDPVTPEGGAAKQSPTGADVKKKVDPKADEVTDGVTKKTKNPEKVVEDKNKESEDDDEDEDDLEESFDLTSLFEGFDLSEAFKKKAALVFEAAVHEEATKKVESILEETEQNLREEFEETLSETVDTIVENLDNYLDYIVKEWMEENTVAIESGIKVEVAESLMSGLKELFYEHNINIDEETIDVVADLEEEIAALKKSANVIINENIRLEEELQTAQSERIFDEITEGLSVSQKERLRVLSEKLNRDDLEEFSEDLTSLKESFFKTQSKTVISEDLDREGDEFITEEAPKQVKSSHDSVNLLAAALSKLQ